MPARPDFRARCGDYWWWSLCIFLSLRIGDVINALVGVWLVPRYVGQAELGAVLPLSGIASFIGTPMAVLVLVFQRYLSQYHAKGEDAKVTSLIRGFIGFSVPAVILLFALGYLLMPLFFERIRITKGSLGILVIAVAAMGTLQPVFTNALQGLGHFRALAIVNFINAPVRFLTMLVAMPIRALSGYMLGQLSGPCVQIAVSAFALRRETFGGTPERGFWRAEGPGMFRYAIKVGIMSVAGALAAAVTTLVIRQRLPAIESAGYYMISRFAEMATYAGGTLGSLMFPFVAAASAQGKDTGSILRKAQLGTVIAGLICVGGLALLGRPVFLMVPLWAPYADFVPDMVLLAVALLVSLVAFNRINCAIAEGDFGFLAPSSLVMVLQSVFLVAFTGYGYFNGILPPAVVDWMASLNVGTLRGVLVVMLVANSLLYASSYLRFGWRKQR